MAKPLKEYQVITKGLESIKLEDIEITQVQSGITVLWSFDFKKGLARVDPNLSYLFGYLDHDGIIELRAKLNELEL